MKPVAWMYQANDFQLFFDTAKPPKHAYDEGTLVPLYTAPQDQTDRIKELEKYLGFKNSGYDIISASAPRELSDEEIDEVYFSITHIKGYPPIYEFARAILKKASEK